MKRVWIRALGISLAILPGVAAPTRPATAAEPRVRLVGHLCSTYTTNNATEGQQMVDFWRNVSNWISSKFTK